jgi:NAD-dependent dihydropyrimidine dehydrogenase PreA subunit
MATDVYERLAEHMDSLPAGYPRTESGVEMRILRRLFTPEDAELALHLTLLPEEARVVARRAGIPVEEAARRLEQMDEKGLIFSMRPPDGPPQYQAQQFAVGVWEFQVNRLSEDLVEDFEEYLPTLWRDEVWQEAPQIRTVPIGESLDAQTAVIPYERAEALVQDHKVFAVSNCICRQEMDILGEGCDKPLESCLMFGMSADHGIRTGRSRAISREEALSLLHQAEEAGLVLQPANAKDVAFICMCCGCCCGVLRSLKRHPHPASIASSPFRASLNVDTCTGCGVCETRCQMGAISLDNGYAVLDLTRCIGCGLCITTCPAESLSLVRKPDEEQPYVPRNIIDTSIRLGQARGMLGMLELIGIQLKSRWDRLLAPR